MPNKVIATVPLYPTVAIPLLRNRHAGALDALLSDIEAVVLPEILRQFQAVPQLGNIIMLPLVYHPRQGQPNLADRGLPSIGPAHHSALDAGCRWRVPPGPFS